MFDFVSSPLDCSRCGACCQNPPYNEAEGFRDWVEVEARSSLLRRPDLVKKLVTVNAAGERHLRLDARGRCLALRGAIGRKVRCDIYAQRPAACRRVQPGDENCLRARAAFFISE